MRKAKIHSRNRNTTTLILLLLFFFLLANALVSFVQYLNEWLDTSFESRTLWIGIPYFMGDSLEEWEEDIEQFRQETEETIQSSSGVISYILDYTQSKPIFCALSDTVTSSLAGCNYESMRDYILTEDCASPEENEMILPKYILVEGSFRCGSYLLSKERKKWVIEDGEAYVGQTISVSLSSENALGQEITVEKEFKVIGVYDNYAMAPDDESPFFVSVAALEELNEARIISPEDYIEYMYGEDVDTAGVMLDDYRSIYMVPDYQVTCSSRDDLLSLQEATGGFCQTSLDETGIRNLILILSVISFLMIFFLINLIINIAFTEEHQIYLNRRKYGLMKSLGYSNRMICLLRLRETLKTALIASGVVFVFGSLVLYGINQLAHPYLNILFLNYQLKPVPVICVLVLLAELVALGVGYFIGIRKILRLEAVDALKGEE